MMRPAVTTDIVRALAEHNPAYKPYCGRCKGLVRMAIVSKFNWRCPCGAEHDSRTAAEKRDQELHSFVHNDCLGFFI